MKTMEKFYSVKCKRVEKTSNYEITKNCFLFEKGENYLSYSRPITRCIAGSTTELINSNYLFQDRYSFIINSEDIRTGDLLCVENDRRTTYFIFIGFFKEKTYERLETIFLVGKGFSTRIEAVEFYNEHKEEIEDKNLEIPLKTKSGKIFTYIRNGKDELQSENVNDFDIQKLSEKSEMVKKALNEKRDFKLYTLYLLQDGLLCNPYNEFSLHPNGNCGCIELDDSNMFGIRCDHLMYCECWCEAVEEFWNEDDNLDNYNVILIYGNHKGLFTIKVLVIK